MNGEWVSSGVDCQHSFSKGLTTFAPVTDRACLNALPSSTPSVQWQHERFLQYLLSAALHDCLDFSPGNAGQLFHFDVLLLVELDLASRLRPAFACGQAQWTLGGH